MKIGWFLALIIPSVFSIEATLLTNFRELTSSNLSWSLPAGAVLAIISLSILCFFAEGLYRFLSRWPRIRDWFVKKRDKDDPWVKRIHKLRYMGLFLGGFAPIIGIPAQKIFQFRYGYFVLFSGNIAKALLIISAIKIFGKFI